MTKAQRSYYAFTRAVRDSKGITWREAQAVYRAYKARGERPTAKAVREHPIIINRLYKDVVKGKFPPRGGVRGPGGPGGVAGGRAGIYDLSRWEEIYDVADDYYDQDIGGGVDTGKAKK